MKTAIALALLALLALGAATVDAEPTCQDLAGQGSACYEAVADPAGGNVDVDVVVVVAPALPPV